MLRAMLSVVHSLLLIAVILGGVLGTAFYYLGYDWVFKEASYELSMNGLIVVLGVEFVAAVIGGFDCAYMSQSNKAAPILAAFLLILGALLAAGQTVEPKPDIGARDGSVKVIQAIERTRAPVWAYWAIPVIGGVACLFGSRLPRN